MVGLGSDAVTLYNNGAWSNASRTSGGFQNTNVGSTQSNVVSVDT